MARTRRLSLAVAGVGVSAVFVTGLATSEAATSTGIGAFSALAGSPGAFTTTMQLPGTGYPAAQMTSTSASGANIPSGATTWFGANTPPGQLFGSSRNAPYLNLRPAADNASSPSVTRYSFASPVPVGWGFVLGDIDSDKVRVSATLADGSDASVAQLGFRGVFNPCSSSPIPSGCSGPEPKDTPTWDPATATLTGNPSGANSYGASGWFVPTVPLSSLMLTFTWRTGFPVYQTWFASVARDVSGTVGVVEGDCDVTATTLNLLAADDSVLATTHPQADGSYGFARVAASDGFRVRLDDVPVGCEAVGPGVRDIDLRTSDDTADFAVQAPAPPASPVTGVVEDVQGDPVPDVVITIVGDDFTQTATTDEAGQFTLDDVPPGDYEITVDPPPGFEVVGDDTVPVTVPEGGGPLDLDFTLRVVATPTATPTGTSAVTTSGSASAPASTADMLPEVGGPSSALVPLGALLLGAGLGLVLAASRGRQRSGDTR